jgi:saccharopine dehydrogenase-like NADP-dependent oxidoreductase
MKILILGAVGQISRMLTERLLNETDAEIVLYARSAHSRLKVTSGRCTSFPCDDSCRMGL